MNIYKGIIISISCVCLFGCSNKKMMEEIDKVEKAKQELLQQELEREKKKKEQYEEYQEMEVPIEEILENIEKETVVEEITPNEDKISLDREHYKEPLEFAQAVSLASIKFTTSKWTENEYYNFLVKHSAKDFKDDFLSNKDQAIATFTSIQNIYKEKRELTPIEFNISNLIANKSNSSAYFYRKEILANGTEAFYITTIVREDGAWRIQDERPSAPYEYKLQIENQLKDSEDQIVESEEEVDDNE